MCPTALADRWMRGCVKQLSALRSPYVTVGGSSRLRANWFDCGGVSGRTPGPAGVVGGRGGAPGWPCAVTPRDITVLTTACGCSVAGCVFGSAVLGAVVVVVVAEVPGLAGCDEPAAAPALDGACFDLGLPSSFEIQQGDEVNRR